MLEALDRHLGRLADVTFIGVFVFDAAGGNLTRHAIERGRMLPVRDVPLADFESYAARAARERREIHVEAEEGGRPATRIPGTRGDAQPLVRAAAAEATSCWACSRCRRRPSTPTASARSSCSAPSAAYAAVAFANARTHGELEDKHRRLVETEAEMRKLATTDPLTGLANRRRFFALRRERGGARASATAAPSAW